MLLAANGWWLWTTTSTRLNTFDVGVEDSIHQPGDELR